MATAEALVLVDVFKRRIDALNRLRDSDDPERAIAELKAYYRTNGSTVADFISDWGITVDPRNGGQGMPSTLPFVLDAKQREWIIWTHENWVNQRYGLTEKSRDVGLSWMLVAYSVAICVLFDGVDVGLGSFSQEKVDKLGVMGSLFEKARCFADALPVEFAAGFLLSNKEDCKDRFIRFPHTKSSIFGEIGDNCGRGNRASIYFTDETAFYEHDMIIDGNLSKTTNCRQDVSTVRGMDNTFAQRAHRGGMNKFTFHWRHNPRFTQVMYDKFLEDWGETITAQELDINYQASVEGIVIPAKWVNASVDAHILLGLEPKGESICALDVADLGIDKNAIAGRKAFLLTYLEEWSGGNSDIFATTERSFNVCDSLKATRLIYDADGLGAGVRGDGRKLNEIRADRKNFKPKIELMAHKGSAAVLDPTRSMVEGRKNEDMFKNYKAQSWWSLRQRFEATHAAIQYVREGGVINPSDIDETKIISISSKIPENVRTKLMIELSQPTYSLNNSGLMLINKTPEGAKSPNYGDAVNEVFAPRRWGLKIADSNLED